jgi:transposase-like protein
MVPTDFKEYFISLDESHKQMIISELIAILACKSQIPSDQKSSCAKCPHCESDRIRGNGFTPLKIQKYYCNGCKKNFSDQTNKVWCGVKKKSDMQKYIYGLLSGYSIRKCALDCKISINTSFIWRHKLLSCFNQISDQSYSGILEIDELFFHESQKGSRNMTRPSRKRGSAASKRGISNEQVAVIATADRQGNKGFAAVKLGRITKENVEKVLENKIEKVETICSDKHVSYEAFTKDKPITHKTIMASHNQRVTEKIYHVQNVNNMDKRLRDFMRPRNGVATKYLQNYLNWFLALEKIKDSINRHAQFATIIISAQQALKAYVQIDLLHNLLRT